LIFSLIKKEFLLELRRKSVISGIALYLFSIVFICYLTFSLRQNFINEATWSALFWLAILFSAVNTVAKSFIGEKTGTFIYLYSVASPHAIIISKTVYNSLLCLLLSFVGYFLFSILMHDPVQNRLVFFAGLILTSIGFATSLSLISGIAAKARNSNVLMAVLSFPVIIAVLLMGIKITKNALDGLDSSASVDELLNLLAINSISATLAYLLFPYIWRS
jgi:heme exporter protein B